MGMGSNNWNGRIDGEKVRQIPWAMPGDGSPIADTWGLNGALGGKGEYDGEVVYRLDTPGGGVRGDFFIWSEQNQNWVKSRYDNKDAIEQFRKNKELQSKNKEGWNVKYKTAVAEVGQNSLRYPDNVSTSSNSDFVLFDFFDYQPPFKDNQQFSDQLPDELKGARSNGWFKKEADYRYFTNQFLEQYNRTGVASNLYKRDVSGTFPQIMLYMPDDISDTLKADWEGKAFGSTTAGILSASGSDSLMEKLKGANNVTQKTIQRAPIEMAASLVTNLAKGITGDTINTGDIFGGISGAIRNPNVEVLFQKMNLRTFDLSFKLVPYDDGEALTIKKIINVFKKSMLPTYSIGDGKVLGTKASENRAIEASFIKVPKVCKVTYMRGAEQHPDLPTYKMCAITDIAINYTPDGNYAVYKDGTPVAYELKVSFMETKLLFSEEIQGAWETGGSGNYGLMAG